MTLSNDTIAALATPRGTGGLAIIRISGSDSWDLGQRLVTKAKPWNANGVFHHWLCDPADGQLLDEVLILAFKGPHSFTGEDCLEIQCHGGLAVSKAILNLCLQQGARPAEAGEFTKRAVLNGRLDLTQAESILDLIHAQGEALVKLSASSLYHKSVSRFITACLEEIARVQADLTASIDFPDEVEEPERMPLAKQLCELVEHIQTQIQSNRQNQVLRDGLEIAVVGRPNAGKSALFNALLASDRSIVTDIAGTTRDVIREQLAINGIPVTLVDTAGLREGQDPVEIMGIARSRQTLETAHAVLYVFDGTSGISAEDLEILAQCSTLPGLLVCNKADLSPMTVTPEKLPVSWPQIQTVATQGKGLADIQAWLGKLAESLVIPDTAFLLSQRQLSALEQIAEEVEDAAGTLSDSSVPLDLATVPLTNALLELQALLGQDTTEQMLDSVFSRFCVGK